MGSIIVNSVTIKTERWDARTRIRVAWGILCGRTIEIEPRPGEPFNVVET